MATVQSILYSFSILLHIARSATDGGTISCGDIKSGTIGNGATPVDFTFTAVSGVPITFKTCNTARDAYLAAKYDGSWKYCNPNAGNTPSGCTACSGTHEVWELNLNSGSYPLQFYWYGGSGNSYYEIEMLCGYPTTTPTTNPSASPTKFPTITPSKNPTEHAQPTNAPITDIPTTAQTTSNPSYPTSANPTQFPTNVPSATPSENPSAYPTTFPSKLPTVSPTTAPTTFNPSESPTKRPSESPMQSTDFPTSHPSKPPTETPSSAPTESPTDYTFCTDDDSHTNAGFVTVNEWSNVVCEFCVCSESNSGLICDIIDFHNPKRYDSYLIGKFMQTCGLDQECSFRNVGLKSASDEVTDCDCDLFHCVPQGNDANVYGYSLGVNSLILIAVWIVFL